MTRALCVCALMAWFSCACDVATVAQVPSDVAQNQCTADSDCPGPGGSCVDNQCESHEGTLQTVLFAVTPPSGTSASADLQFLKQADLPTAGGDWDLPLDAVAQIVGDVKLVPPRTCKTSFDNNGTMLVSSGDNSVPGTISLTPSQKQLGVFSQSAVAQTTLINTSSFSFSMNVPPGDYDIYYQPQHQLNDNCIVSPQLLRNQPITPDLRGLHLTLPESSKFEFHVNWPAGDGMLNGWTADMLDPVSGHVISNRAQLALGASGKFDYVATIYYLPVIGDTSDQTAQELVRLSPPDCVTPPDCVIAPTILLSRSALGLFDADKGTLSDFTTLPTKVHIHGQVTAAATPKPVAATVTLVATNIFGIQPGVLASFVRTVTAGVDGQFELDVLPGSYRVTAVPSAQLDTEIKTKSIDDSKLAEVSEDWTVADSPLDQAGKVIELGNALPINGAAFNASGSTPVVTALVQAVASTASTQVDVLHQALGEAVVVPRAATARVEPDGDFGLIADPGTFDVSVRPLAASGFSWLVVPSVAVGTTSAGVSLMSRALPLPVVYRGTVTLPGAGGAPTTTVPGALIRAFVYTSAGQYTSEPAKADAVVQVAESRADTKGGFKLLIPASLNGAVR